MVRAAPAPRSLKRKRKGHAREPPSLSTRLQLAERLAGDAVELSQDLVRDLRIGSTGTSDLYIAVRDWTPSAAVVGLVQKWVIVPCRPIKKELDAGGSGTRIGPNSRHLHTLVSNLKINGIPRTRSAALSLDVRVTNVNPIGLDTVYVNIDAEALAKHDQVQKQYAGGFVAKKRSNRQLNTRHSERSIGQIPTRSPDELRDLVRESISRPALLHTGDLVQLALPAHPITHAAPPAFTIAACEPVAQGLVTDSTRIVLLMSEKVAENRAKSAQSPVLPLPVERLPEVSEDTSNEAFYTAAEDGNTSSAPATPSRHEPLSLSDTEDETDGNLSDDSDSMISLTTPALSSQASGMLSAIALATPRPLGRHLNGSHTPGSVISTMTTTTMRGGHPMRTKILRTQGLMQRIPDDLLHPRPLSHEDDEARVYVETSVLAKLGCFSGDWVEVSPATDPKRNGLTALGMSSFLDHTGDEESPRRSAKVFGLPDVLGPRSSAQYKVQGRGRSGSFSSTIGPSSTPVVYLSPILLTNLGDPAFLRLNTMRASEDTASNRPSGRMPSTSLPPAARDANLLKIQSPASTDKTVDANVFNGLIAYFESKQRLVKTGDLIAISVDESAGRAVYDGGSAEQGVSNDILSFLDPAGSASDTSKASVKVVWFQVGPVSSHMSGEKGEHEDVWNGLASMIPSKTKMHQSGTQQRKLPPASSSTWPYYQGLLKAPLPRESKAVAIDGMPSQPVSALQRRLGELMATATSARATHFGLPAVAVLLHSTQRNIGKTHTATAACLDLGMHCFPINAFDVMTEAAAGGGGDNNSVGLFESRAERALQCGAEHTCILVQHIEALNSDRMFGAVKDVLAESRILVATTTDLDKVPENIRGLFTHELEMSAPGESEREAILASVLARSATPVSAAVDLAAIAVKTAALVAGDLLDVVDRAIAARSERLEKMASQAGDEVSIHDITVAGGESVLSLLPADFDMAVDLARKNFADSIGAPKIPNVQWSDVGGLANVKEAVMETIQLPLSRPELFARGLKKRSGILFYGPPGSGKTLLAKAIATEFSLNFFSVKGPELLNMYIGESEANVRRVFQRARDARPCVVFFDELDSVAPKRGNQGDSGGVMDRIVSQLLAELDGMSDGDDGNGGGAGVFVIGATNRPDLLDQALLRPGRFDKMLYLGVSDTHEKQAKILEALTRKFTLAPSISLSNIAASLPMTYTGADLYALCSDAMLKAITRSAQAVDSRVATINNIRASSNPPRPPITIAHFFDHHASEADLAVQVSEQDFLEANRELVPSVSAEELGHYERVRRDFEGVRDKKQSSAHANRDAAGPTTTTTGLGPNPTAEEVQTYQAARIEEMIRAGMQDGSLAKGGDKGRGEGRTSRVRLDELLRRSGVGHGAGVEIEGEADDRTISRASTRVTDADDGDEDLVVRTGTLSVDGHADGERHHHQHHHHHQPKGKDGRFFHRDTKGKGKEKEGSRMRSMFGGSKGKGKGKEKERTNGHSVGGGGGGDGGDKEETGFGDAADDKGLYDD